MNHPESLQDVFSALVRRGLPADYAKRAAAELSDHHRDLVDELRENGWEESAATMEANRRLGDERSLVNNTVRAYRRRFWCGRWPIVTFLLAPIPTFIATYIGLAYAMMAGVALLVRFGVFHSSELNTVMSAAPWIAKFAVLCTLFVLLPTLIAYLFARLARRAAVPAGWVALAACLIGLSAGAVCVERAGYGTRYILRDGPGGQPLARQPSFVLSIPILETAIGHPSKSLRWYANNPMQACQFLLPLAAAACVVLRTRQRAMRYTAIVTDGS